MRLITLFMAAAVLPGCADDGISPEDRLILTGTYPYYAVIDRPETAGPADTLQGSVVITLASPDSIRAVFQVPGLSPDTVTGGWNIDAFVLTADPTSWTGNMNHRVWRSGASNQVACDLRYVWYPPQGGNPTTENGTCDIG